MSAYVGRQVKINEYLTVEPEPFRCKIWIDLNAGQRMDGWVG